jgi:5-methylcytosine-specific restriction endonuclease McrA
VSAWKAPRGWRRLREAVFRRDGHVCYRCGRWAGTIDHVIPLALGGDHSLSNLRPACQRCNSSTGASLGNKLQPRTPPRQLRAWIAAGKPPGRSARGW